MFRVKDSQSGTTTSLVFHTVTVLALIHPCRGQSEVVGEPQPIIALVGDDIILPCRLHPAMDASDMTVEWARSDLDPRFVLVWRDGVELEAKKHPSYQRRTSLFPDQLKHGNISLKLSNVKLSDQGRYRCFVPALSKEFSVQLFVGAASSPVVTIAGINKTISAVVLECKSKGWYPEPEVLWLDGEGNLLSAGPTETVRGPDDLYTVSSRVTVEKRHSNSFTCRVQQNKTNQTRETHIHVPDDFFPSSSSSSVPAIVGVVVSLLLVLTLVFIVWKWRQNKLKNKSKCDVEQTQEVKEKRSNSDSNDPLMEPLMRNRETERETVENEEMKIHPSRETTNIHTQIKEETHQRPTDSDLQSAVEGGRPQQRGQTERETTNGQEETETLSAEGRGDDPNPTESDLEKGDKTTSVGENTNVNDKTTIHPSAQTTNPDTHIEEKTHQTPADSDLQGESPQEQGQTERETTTSLDKGRRKRRREETESEPGEKQRDDPNPPERNDDDKATGKRKKVEEI
ncbi:butyrophilin subfamily 3 member A2 [Lates calcarifer]|nr:butyrophilin subfamily 3 member A2 [Lates calcarifer]